MGSNLGLIGLGLVALFATSMIKIVAIAAIGWGGWKAYKIGERSNEYLAYGYKRKESIYSQTLQLMHTALRRPLRK